MHVLAISMSIIGCISSIITCAVNIYVLYKIAPWRMTKKKNYFLLFYYRFTIDVFLGLLVAVYLGFVICYGFNPDSFEKYKEFVFFLSLPSSNLGAIRSIVTLTIAIEMNLAAYTPIMFHNFRRSFPTYIMFIIAVSYGLFEDVVLFQFCHFDLIIPTGCFAFGCTINECFRIYWSSHKSIVFALTAFFSLTLCLKLLIMSKSGIGIKNADTRRANRLALLDAGVAFAFNFLPSFVANQTSQKSFFSFENIGPYGAATQLFGYAIESYLVSRSLLRKTQIIGENSKSTNRSNNIHIATQNGSR